MNTASPSSLPGRRKAAILMVVLGEEISGDLLRRLPEEDVQVLTREIASLGTVPPETTAEVLEEYSHLFRAQEYVAQGGAEYASRMLVNAFGREEAGRLLEQVTSPRKRNGSGLDVLRQAGPEELARFVEGEQPQTIALVLAHLGARTAAALLARIPQAIQAETVRRLATMKESPPELVRQVSSVLARKLRAAPSPERPASTGTTAVAVLLSEMGSPACEVILDALETSDPHLTASLRSRLTIAAGDESEPETLKEGDRVL